jgi:hypothetical protein
MNSTFIVYIDQSVNVNLNTSFNLLIILTKANTNTNTSTGSTNTNTSTDSTNTNISMTNVPANFLPPQPTNILNDSNNSSETFVNLNNSKNDYNVQIIDNQTKFNDISKNLNQIILANSNSPNPYEFEFANPNTNTYKGISSNKLPDVNGNFTFYNSDYNFTNINLMNYLQYSKNTLYQRSIYKLSPTDTNNQILLFNKLNTTPDANLIYVYPQKNNFNPKPNLQLVLNTLSANTNTLSTNTNTLSTNTNTLSTNSNTLSTNTLNKQSIYSILSNNNNTVIPTNQSTGSSIISNNNKIIQYNTGSYYIIIENNKIYNSVSISNSNSLNQQLYFENIYITSNNLTVPVYSDFGNGDNLIGYVYLLGSFQRIMYSY